MKIKNVLFVCLGNTARSPVAEYLARKYAKKYNLDLEFQSAGFLNAFSYMQPESQEYLNLKNIDHDDFKPQLITRELLKNQDLILTMESKHKSEIINSYNNISNIQNKVFTLKEFNGETTNIDIIDPYYTSKKTYYKILTIIDEFVEKSVRKIANLD